MPLKQCEKINKSPWFFGPKNRKNGSKKLICIAACLVSLGGKGKPSKEGTFLLFYSILTTASDVYNALRPDNSASDPFR